MQCNKKKVPKAFTDQPSPSPKFREGDIRIGLTTLSVEDPKSFQSNHTLYLRHLFQLLKIGNSRRKSFFFSTMKTMTAS